MKKPACLLSLLAVFVLSSPAEEEPADSISEASRKAPVHNAEQTLDEIVVTGTRTYKWKNDTPVLTRVISASDIEKADATDVEDLLSREIPGAEFSYAMNQQKHLNLNGFGGQSILFLVDGERLSGETMDDVDFARLALSIVQKIEILKESGSVLYGSNAAGGVINIITKEHTEPWRTEVDGRLAKHGETRLRGTVSVSKNKVRNTFNAGRTTRNTFFVHNDGNPVAPVFSSVFGHQTWNLNDKITITPSERLKIVGKAGHYFREISRTEDSPERYRDYSASLRASWKRTERDGFDFSYTFDQYDKSVFYKQTVRDVRHYSNVQNTFRCLYSRSAEGGNIFTAGTDYTHDYLLNTHLKGFEKSQSSFSSFAQYDWMLTSRWELLSALRFDRFSDGNDSHVTPKLSVRFRPKPELNLRLSYGRGFRAPALKEKYYLFDMAGIWIVKGNPLLKAELSHNVNLSADYKKGTLGITASAYFNKVKDKLATGIPHRLTGEADGLVLEYVNLASYAVCGGEIMLQQHWGNGFDASLSYAHTHEQLPVDKEGNRITPPYIPARKHALVLNGNWEKQTCEKRRLRLSLNGRVLSGVKSTEYIDYYDLSKGTHETVYPAYMLWKLSACEYFGDVFKLTFAVDNLLNYRPRHYYMNAPVTDGANLMIGFALSLSKPR